VAEKRRGEREEGFVAPEEQVDRTVEQKRKKRKLVDGETESAKKKKRRPAAEEEQVSDSDSDS
jgi:hypothetical protein